VLHAAINWVENNGKNSHFKGRLPQGREMIRMQISLQENRYKTTKKASRVGLPRAYGLGVAIVSLVILLSFVFPVSGQSVQPDDTPGFIPGDPITVRSCDDGARCSGGADCINKICVDPCKGGTNPFCACDCVLSGPEPEFPWVVVVGGLAAVAAAAVLISQILKNKPKKKGQQPLEVYILQISKDNLTVSPKKNDSFTATAWKITESGGTLPAPSAFIQADTPVNVTGLSVTPPSGNGSLTSIVSLTNYAGPGSAVITVTASGGGGRISAKIMVKIEAEAEIEFD
jgi:hypothetical protein